MKPRGIAPTSLLVLAVFLTGCASLRGDSVSEVSGCVVTAEPVVRGHCIHVELHQFRSGVLLAPGSYLLKEHQVLNDAMCFRFFAATGKRVAVKTRDSDRSIVGGRVYVTAGDASIDLVVHHQRYAQPDRGGSHSCERPPLDTE